MTATERSTARTKTPASDPIPVCTCAVRIKGARTVCPEHGPHSHECMDRMDDVCIARGACQCECGATRAFREEGDQHRNAWVAVK